MTIMALAKKIIDRLSFRLTFWIIRVYCILCRAISVQQSLPLSTVETMTLHFPNPVGLSAGFDRDGKLAGWLAPAGFGFVEIGTINVDSEAAAETELAYIARTLQKAGIRSHLANNSANRQLLGISLGSKRDTLDERTVADYLKGMQALWQYANYLVINLSRPGSQVRASQPDAAALRFLLKNIKQGHAVLAARFGNRVPVIIKLAINYQSRGTLPDTLIIARELEFDGLITTFEHWTSRKDINNCIREISASIQPLPLIAVGGIQSSDDAMKTLEAGASLVQLYTGLVRQGPLQIRRMITRLCKNPNSGYQDGNDYNARKIKCRSD